MEWLIEQLWIKKKEKKSHCTSKNEELDEKKVDENMKRKHTLHYILSVLIWRRSLASKEVEIRLYRAVLFLSIIF